MPGIRGLGGVGLVTGAKIAAASRKIAKPRSMGKGRMVRIHFDRKVHPLKIVGNRSHWQVNIWKANGSKGSGRAFRMPVRRSF